VAEFKDNWVKEYTPEPGDRISRAVRREGPLKPRLDAGVNIVRRQKGILDRMVSRLESRDRTLLAKVAAAKSRHDMHSARVLASELSEMRKVKKMMLMAKLALEKAEIRLSVYVGLGDTVAVIAPAIQIMRKLGVQLGRFIPEADTEINQMTETLNSLMSNTVDENAFSVSSASDYEIESIMQEAAVTAGREIGSKFPPLPPIQRAPGPANYSPYSDTGPTGSP
jgi:division protein CdvB (Snf7/Vps24/ESCRT-III family)